MICGSSAILAQKNNTSDSETAVYVIRLKNNFVSKQVQEFVASKFIQWSFNTEAAPWTGGIFERMIKSVKRCLKKELRKVVHGEINYFSK